MKLTDTKCKNAKAKDKNYKISDGDGLVLMVKASGSKIWHFNYSYDLKRNTISFGRYPEISLSDARKMRHEARTALLNGINPSAERKKQRSKQIAQDGLQQTLRAMLEDRPFLIAVGKRSYLHGNGFYKIILSDEEDFVLRANIWMPGMHAEENLHDHRWHLASTIITGTLESEIWEDASSPDAAVYDEYIYFGKTSEKDAHMMPIGKIRISLKEKVIHRAGECYNLPSNVMHRIVSTGKTLTSTLMCHPAPARKWGRVVSFNPIEPDVERAYLDESQMQDLVEEYLRLCN